MNSTSVGRIEINTVKIGNLKQNVWDKTYFFPQRWGQSLSWKYFWKAVLMLLGLHVCPVFLGRERPVFDHKWLFFFTSKCLWKILLRNKRGSLSSVLWPWALPVCTFDLLKMEAFFIVVFRMWHLDQYYFHNADTKSAPREAGFIFYNQLALSQIVAVCRTGSS